MDNVVFRASHTPAELRAFVDLEMAIWGLAARDAVPASLLHALAQNGGVLVGAYAGPLPVGMALGFPARRSRRWLLWSYISGVHPDYQRQGIGLALKEHQRAWALANGFTEMRWTFDPLQAGNAHFNLSLLGVCADTYHINYYGELDDAINAGLPSDRVEAVWDLRRPAPGAALADAAVSAAPAPQQVEIPARLDTLSPAAVLDWRLALRAALQPALARGSRLVAFQRDGSRCWYTLAAPAPWFLYVLECADGSLYTGVTTDLERRLTQHNAGRGAAYTSTRRPVRHLGSWRFDSRSAALRAEAAFKQQPRATKLKRLAQQAPFQDGVFTDDR